MVKLLIVFTEPTFKSALPETPLYEAEILTTSALTPVAKPVAEIVATALFPLVQVAELVTSCVLQSS